jgi:hypothetical protein
MPVPLVIPLSGSRLSGLLCTAKRKQPAWRLRFLHAWLAKYGHPDYSGNGNFWPAGEGSEHLEKVTGKTSGWL